MFPSDLVVARLQMALSPGFHIIFAEIGGPPSFSRCRRGAQVSLILWGWLIAQYPYLIPPALTIRDAAAPAVTLRLLAVGLAGGAAILLPSLRYLLRTFKGGSTLSGKVKG